MLYNAPISSYDEVTSLSTCFSISEEREVNVYVNVGTDAEIDA